MQMFIAGKWVDKQDVIEVRNPYDNSLVDTVPRADEADVEKAIRSAQAGFKIMRDMPAHKRAEILRLTSERIREQSEDFAHVLVREVGKTIREARGEVARAVQAFTVASEEAKRIRGQTIPFDAVAAGEGRSGYYMRVPAGVVLAVTPFNFPLNLAAHKLAPAIAAGNSVILKPASLTPLADIMLGQAMLHAGLPEDALNIITGPGNIVGELLARDPRIRVVTFTGSVEVGAQLAASAGLKKISMELGSNSAVILMDDCDLTAAIGRIVTGAYAVAGQVCISVQRLIVHEAIYDRFLDEFVRQVKKLSVGDPMNETTDVGTMISENAASRAEEWIVQAVAQGARCLTDVKRQGTLLHPTVLTEVTEQMKVFSEEAFAPLVTVNRCGNLSQAIELANHSRYGLQAGIYTRSLSNAFEAVRTLDVGGVIINDIPSFRVDLMPYGGMKDSGVGREGLKYAIEEMTEIKLVCFKH